MSTTTENIEKRFCKPVDIVTGITRDSFKEKYADTDQPVILRGLWDDYPAQEKWTIDFFKDELGDLKVGVFDAKMQTDDRSFKKPHRYLQFSEYLDHVISDSPEDIRLFLFNILKHKPDLKKDFDFPDITSRYLKNYSFMFFGLKGSKVRIHQDMDWANVFLTQLHGRKEVFLFDPKYSDQLYRYPFGVHSSVDVENPDYETYPALKEVEGYHCIMEPGDTLFIPSGYWHFIKYLEGGYAINQRTLHRKPSRWLKGFYHVAILSTIDDMMRKVLGDSWYNFKKKKAHETADKSMILG